MGWQFSSERPIYTQLVEQIALRVITGVYAPGARLPSVRELAEEAQVNPNTMQRAMAELETRGLLRTERTSGRFVTEDEALLQREKRQLAKTHISVFFTNMQNLGLDAKEALALAAEEGVEAV